MGESLSVDYGNKEGKMATGSENTCHLKIEFQGWLLYKMPLDDRDEGVKEEVLGSQDSSNINKMPLDDVDAQKK